MRGRNLSAAWNLSAGEGDGSVSLFIWLDAPPVVSGECDKSRGSRGLAPLLVANFIRMMTKGVVLVCIQRFH